MIEKTEFDINIEKNKTIEAKIIDIVEDIRLMNIDNEIINSISNILKNGDWTGSDTMSYVDNKIGVSFYFYPDLSCGGMKMNFKRYNKNLKNK